jgi:branched-chain amino acid transport system substrate-binding protein
VIRLVVCCAALTLAGVAGAAVSDRRPVPLAGCDRLYYEREGSPDLLIVSDLPMEASAHTAMRQMEQAIKLTLKNRDFRAGIHSVGYVPCDDSGPSGTWSATRCRRNAVEAASLAKVVGVIGTLDSGCAGVELPILGRAHVVLVSPLNTASDLKSSARARIARLSASDDAQAAAAARFIRDRGARTVAVFADGTRRGNVYRTAFLAAASRVGLRMALGRADAAYVGGLLSGRTPAELSVARRRVPSGPIVLAEGLGPAAQLATEVGPSAEGVYLVVAGVPSERLGSAGNRFVRQFEERIGAAPHPYAVYAAQAAEILLDAVASSRGTRTGTGRAVLAEKVVDGPLGSFSFDRDGNSVPAPVTIFQVKGRRAELVRVVNSALP